MAESPSIEAQIDRLAHQIDRMNRLYRRFLAGDPGLELDTLPKMEDRIRDRLRRLQGTNMKRAEDRYRLSNLEARFHSYLEMFRRRRRKQEEGKLPGTAGEIAGRDRPGSPRGVVVGSSPSSAAVESLFTELYSKSGRRMKMDLDTFQRYLNRQVSEIREKTGCASVQFRLVGEGDSVKLKARPLHRSGPDGD